MNLSSKTALVTGGSSGIGKAIVLALAQQGCNVVFTYHSKKQQAENLKKEIEQLGVKCLVAQVDMRQEEEIDCLFATIKKEFPKIDILVNNAGINRPRDLFDTKVWKEVFQVNLFSVVLCTQKAV